MTVWFKGKVLVGPPFFTNSCSDLSDGLLAVSRRENRFVIKDAHFPPALDVLYFS